MGEVGEEGLGTRLVKLSVSLVSRPSSPFA